MGRILIAAEHCPFLELMQWLHGSFFLLDDLEWKFLNNAMGIFGQHVSNSKKGWCLFVHYETQTLEIMGFLNLRVLEHKFFKIGRMEREKLGTGDLEWLEGAWERWELYFPMGCCCEVKSKTCCWGGDREIKNQERDTQEEDRGEEMRDKDDGDK